MHLEKIELAFARDAFGRHSSTRTDVWVLNAHQTIIHPVTRDGTRVHRAQHSTNARRTRLVRYNRISLN